MRPSYSITEIYRYHKNGQIVSSKMDKKQQNSPPSENGFCGKKEPK